MPVIDAYVHWKGWHNCCCSSLVPNLRNNHPGSGHYGFAGSVSAWLARQMGLLDRAKQFYLYGTRSRLRALALGCVDGIGPGLQDQTSLFRAQTVRLQTDRVPSAIRKRLKSKQVFLFRGLIFR